MENKEIADIKRNLEKQMKQAEGKVETLKEMLKILDEELKK